MENIGLHDISMKQLVTREGVNYLLFEMFL